VTAQVLGGGGEDVIAESRELPVERHREAAVSFAEDLADRGARELVAAAEE
jgi:hydroxymethylbilane synthase